MRCDLPDEAATRRFGALLAATRPAAGVVLLSGELGTGKTTLVRAFLRALGHAGAVRSPTYTLLEPYALPAATVYHLDLYRLGDPGELEYLGLRDLLDDAAIFMIEWPERGRGGLPPADLELTLRHAGTARQLEVEASSPAGAAWLAAAERRFGTPAGEQPGSAARRVAE
jgi:tRNA threonylcarbamoyladenosine biosynthesis protein TsaE